MAKETVDLGVGEAKVDLEKYTELVLKVDEGKTKSKRWKNSLKNYRLRQRLC